MQNINVRRYEKLTTYQGTIEPEDRSWILFIAANGKPELWVLSGETGEPGKAGQSYRLAQGS